jgi:hypothetical protein
MTPAGALWRRYTGTGRLHGKCVAAYNDPDPGRSMRRLRDVRDRIGKSPAKHAELWQPLLMSMVDDRRRPLLTDGDFLALETIGGQVVRASGVIGIADAWGPLITAREARGEMEAAFALMTRLYTSPMTSVQVKAYVAARLAQYGALGADQMAVYVDVLGRPELRTPEVDRLVAGVLRVDFDSPIVRIGQAGELALLLSEARIGVPGTHTAIGLHHLLVTGDAALAADHMARAFAASPRDETALAGLLAARLRQGDHADIDTAAANRPPSRRVAELVELRRTLAWLDDPAAGGPVPADTARLSRLSIGVEAGEWLGYATGRMALLTGDIERAAALLPPLAESHPDRPQWGYHAAWALLLRDDRDGVASLFDRARGEWTIGCLLLDADPGRDSGGEVTRAIAAAPDGYARLAAARMRLAEGGPAPAVPEWRPGAGTLPEDLEALRTVLGLRAARGERAELASALKLPLFRHLPAPERLLWAGVAALPDDPARGRDLLTEAAVTHRRAATVLAAHELAAGRIDAVTALIDGPAGPKEELLLAWALARRGDDEAALARLDRIPAARRIPKARYLRARLLLRRAVERQSAEMAGEAAAEFDAVATAEGPSISGALARAAEVFATGTVRDVLPSVRDHPWAAWVLGLARLAHDPAGTDLGECERLVGLLDRVARPPDAAVTALAAALAHAALVADDDGRTKTLAELLGRLTERFGSLPQIHRSRELALAAADRRNEATALPDAPGGVLLALAAARRAIAQDDLTVAARLLRAAQPADEAERETREILLGILDGDPPRPMPDHLPPAVAALLELTSAAFLADTDPRRCRELIIKALPGVDPDVLSELVDMGRALPMLSAGEARMRARARPSPLAGLLDRLAAASRTPVDDLTLARCATAIGDFPAAERLWQAILDRGEDVPEAEYVNLLCHQAQRARGKGDPLDAVRPLRQAARLHPDQPPAVDR